MSLIDLSKNLNILFEKKIKLIFSESLTVTYFLFLAGAPKGGGLLRPPNLSLSLPTN